MNNKRMELMNRVDREYRDLDTLGDVWEMALERDEIEAIQKELKVKNKKYGNNI